MTSPKAITTTAVPNKTNTPDHAMHTTTASAAMPTIAAVPLSLKLAALRTIATFSPQGYKGSSGRVAIIGGSKDYCGAPYFAAMAALRGGCDMATVVTTPSASGPIKAMSADLIVRAMIPPPTQEGVGPEDLRNVRLPPKLEAELELMLSRAHSVIIGPGLATDMQYRRCDCSNTDDNNNNNNNNNTPQCACEENGEISPAFVEWLGRSVLCGEKKDQRSSSAAAAARAAALSPPCIVDASGIPLLASIVAKWRRMPNTEAGESSDVVRDRRSDGSADAIIGALGRLPELIITPNVNEINILYNAVVRAADNTATTTAAQVPLPKAITNAEKAVIVSKAMHCCVLLKGGEDFVAFRGEPIGTVSMNLWADQKKVVRQGSGRGHDALLARLIGYENPIATVTGRKTMNSPEEEDEGTAGVGRRGRIGRVTIAPCPRRVAGQGDILSGLVGSFLAWEALNGGTKRSTEEGRESPSDSCTVRAAVGASLVMKYAAFVTRYDDCANRNNSRCLSSAPPTQSLRFVTSDILPNVSVAADVLSQWAAEAEDGESEE